LETILLLLFVELMLPLGLPGDDTVDPMEEFGVNFWVGMVAVVVAEAADRADLAATTWYDGDDDEQRK